MPDRSSYLTREVMLRIGQCVQDVEDLAGVTKPIAEYVIVEALRTPLLRHGVEANRRVLETAAQYSVEQGLTPRLVKLEEVFAACTLEQ